MEPFRLFPEQASTGAARVDAIFFVLMGLSLLFSLGVAGALAYFAYKFWHTRENVSRANENTSSTPIEFTWTVVPLVMALGVFVWGARLYYVQETPPDGAMEIYVTGKQWMWMVQHPNGVGEINELHVPKGRAVRLMLTSQDVIHSFFVPAFRIKQDVLPGRFTSEWFEATKTGRFHLFCAEYCGTNHSRMEGWVTVMEPADFEEWLRTGGGANAVLPKYSAVERNGKSFADPVAAAGEQVFQRLGCNDCHGANATIQAPPLQGLFGRRQTIQDGTVMVDEEYLRESILDPRAKIVAGYEPIMPTFQGQITTRELVELIAYLKFLGTNPSSSPAGDGTEPLPQNGRLPALPQNDATP